MTIIFIVPVANVDPSSMPAGDDSHAEMKVALGRHIESNCMHVSPFKQGRADNELYSMSTAIPIPKLSSMGIGPLSRIVGIFLIR
jgi:hypothetical protein